jgi:hypothetical protein
MKKLFAVLMALGLVGFMACSSPSAEQTEAEATDETGAVMDEMESNMDESSDEMAEEATEEEGTAEEAAMEETPEEAAPEAPEAE